MNPTDDIAQPEKRHLKPVEGRQFWRVHYTIGDLMDSFDYFGTRVEVDAYLAEAYMDRGRVTNIEPRGKGG